jgi:hypothetical protein
MLLLLGMKVIVKWCKRGLARAIRLAFVERESSFGNFTSAMDRTRNLRRC